MAKIYYIRSFDFACRYYDRYHKKITEKIIKQSKTPQSDRLFKLAQDAAGGAIGTGLPDKHQPRQPSLCQYARQIPQNFQRWADRLAVWACLGASAVWNLPANAQQSAAHPVCPRLSAAATLIHAHLRQPKRHLASATHSAWLSLRPSKHSSMDGNLSPRPKPQNLPTIHRSGILMIRFYYI